MKRFTNVVPQSYRRAVVARRAIRDWSFLGLIIGSALGLYVAVEVERLRSSYSAMQTESSAARPYIEMSATIERLRSEIEAIERGDALLRRLKVEGSPLGPVALISKASRACQGRVWIQDFHFESNSHSGSAGGLRPAPAPRTTPDGAAKADRPKMTVTGTAADHLAAAEFVAALRDSNAFRTVELKSSITTETMGKTAWAFVVESEL